MRTQQPVQVVSGRVSGAGVILGGTGFTVTRDAAGNYTIRPTVPGKIIGTTACPDVGATFAMPNGAHGERFFGVSTYNYGGGNVDQQFNFTMTMTTLT